MAGGASDGPEVGRGWGGHTGEKIGIFADYLPLFARASQRSSERVYIDAFAGTTENTLRATGESFAGSAEIALAVEPSFTHVALFEKDPPRARTLRALAARHGAGRDVGARCGPPRRGSSARCLPGNSWAASG